MDTDFEDECKEIHRRRIEASDKLKKIDKDEAKVTKQITASPSKMQDILAIVSTACEVMSYPMIMLHEMNMNNIFLRFARARMTRTRCCCVTAVTRVTTSTASSRPSRQSPRETGSAPPVWLQE